MSSVITSRSPASQGIGLTVAAALAVWFVLVFVLGAVGAFGAPPGTPPLPIFVGVLAPLIALFLFYRFSAAFRDFVLSIDLRAATAIQAWRAAGLGFIALYVYQILPGSFRLASRPGRPGDRADGALGDPGAYPPSRLCIEQGVRRLESARPAGSRERRRHWRTQLGTGHRCARGDHDRSDGSVATRVRPGLSGPDFRHVPRRRALSVASAGEQLKHYGRTHRFGPGWAVVR